jgi:signal transduction histidine kinase
MSQEPLLNIVSTRDSNATISRFRKTPWQLILVFFILVIVICSVGLFYYESQWKLIKKEKQDELLAIADLKMSQIVNWRKERLADAATIFENSLLAPHIRELLQDHKGAKGKRQIRAWMESFRAAFQYDDILLLDKKGTILLSVVQKSEGIGTDAKKLSSSAMKTQQIIFSDLYRSEVSQKIHLSIVVPILDREENETLGVVLLQIDPYVFLYPLIQTWPTPSPTGETILISRDGDEVVYLNDLRYRKDTALIFRLPISDRHLPEAMAARGKEGIFEGIDYRGSEVLSAIRSIPTSSWSIISKIDKKEVYAPIRWRLWNVMLVIGLCIFSAGTVVIFIWRKREQEEQRAYRESLEATVRERTAELERANNQLQEFNKDLESFSYSVSHDLRQPLIVIEGFARSLIKKYGDKFDDYGKENLSIIRDQAAKMTRLINDLLSFCRASTKEIQKSDIDVSSLTHSIVEEMKATIGERTVQFEVRDLPVIWGDSSMIRQVMVNLLSNALKYTRARDIARIEIGGAEKEEGNIYYVKDNGVGFDGENAANLFSMFHRLHTAEEFEGTGIGLVITKRVVNKHGGRIWAEGKINEGATFYFTLPRKA